MSESNSHHLQYHTWVSIKHKCVQVHASDAMPTHKSKLASIKLENTRKYLRMTLWVLVNDLASTCEWPCGYSRMTLRVLTNDLASTHKLMRACNYSHTTILWACHTINEPWYTCRIAIIIGGDTLSCFVSSDTVCQGFKNWCRKRVKLVG